MRLKLGLLDELKEDIELIDDFMATLQLTGNDFTNTFRNLTKLS